MKNCVKCGKQLMNRTIVCKRCGALQPPKKPTNPITIGIMSVGLLYMAFICFVVTICFSKFFGLVMKEYYATYGTTQVAEGETEGETEEGAEVEIEDETEVEAEVEIEDETEVETRTKVEYQLYEDNYLSYEIPSTWGTNAYLIDESNYITEFLPIQATTKFTSYVNIIIVNFINGEKLENVDFSDEEYKKSFQGYLLSLVGNELPEEAADGLFKAITINDHHVYLLGYDIIEEETVLHQRVYFLMDFDYTIMIYASNYLDDAQPTANQVAEHVIESLEIKSEIY